MAELSLDSAQQGYVTLRDRYPEIFAKISPVIQKAVVNNKTWFRVQVPMDSFSVAVNFCKSLKTHGILNALFRANKVEVLLYFLLIPIKHVITD